MQTREKAVYRTFSIDRTSTEARVGDFGVNNALKRNPFHTGKSKSHTFSLLNFKHDLKLESDDMTIIIFTYKLCTISVY